MPASPLTEDRKLTRQILIRYFAGDAGFLIEPSFGENKTFVSSDDDCEDSRLERMDDTKNCVVGCLRWRRKTHTKCCFPAEKSSKESINKNYNNKERSDEKET